MARIRTIKPEAFASESLAALSLEAERSFFGLLTQVDDQGRVKDRPMVLNGSLWALRPNHTSADMEADIAALVENGLGCRYEVDGLKVFHLPTFTTHQVIARPSKAKLPPCPHHDQAPAAPQEPSQATETLPGID